MNLLLESVARLVEHFPTHRFNVSILFTFPIISLRKGKVLKLVEEKVNFSL